MRAVTIVARIAVVVATLAATWPAAADELDELDRRLARLETRLDRLSGLDDALERRRRAATRGLIATVLADAAARGRPGLQPADDGGRGGWDGDFFIASGDDRHRIQVRGRLQFRAVYNGRRGADDRLGFEHRRLRVDVSGRLFEDAVGFTAQVQLLESATGLHDAYLRFEPTPEAQVRLGRFRPPFLKEDAISGTAQLAVERSLVRSAFSVDRSSGVQLLTGGSPFRVRASLQDEGGLGADDVWVAAARLDWTNGDHWSQLRDPTSFPDDPATTVVGLGAAVLYRSVDLADPMTDDERSWRWTVDATVERCGVNGLVALTGSRVDTDDGPTRDRLGLVAQGGLFLTQRLELFARYEWGDADDGTPELSVVTIGVNRYIVRHDLKLTVDVGYGLDEVSAFWSSRGAGWRADTPGRDGQLVIRSQMQLLW